MISKKKAISWSFINKFAPELVNFFVTIIVSRIIGAYDFGNLSIILIILGFSNLLIDFGLGEVIINKKDSQNENLYNSIFWFQFFVSIILFILYFLLSNAISIIFNSPDLIPLIKISSINLVLAFLYAIPYNIMIKKLEFSKISLINFISTLVSAFFVIYFTLSGYGLYAIIYRQIIIHTLNTFLFYYFSSWRPKLIFSYLHIKEILNISTHFTLIKILNTGYNYLINLVFVYQLGQMRMGIYNRAEAFKKVGVNSIDGALQLV